MPAAKTRVPSTIRRSPRKAQRTWRKVREHAEQEYGSGERAYRTAYAVLKHGFEKRGDHWEPKEHPGPSDPRSIKTTREKRQGRGETFGGVDYYGRSNKDLYARAKRLGVRGRSRMSKKQLARAIERKQ